VLGVPGVSMKALKVRRAPSSTYTRIRCGVLSGPCHRSMSASKGRPSVFMRTWTRSMLGLAKDQVRRDPPWTRVWADVSQIRWIPFMSPRGPDPGTGLAPAAAFEARFMPSTARSLDSRARSRSVRAARRFSTACSKALCSNKRAQREAKDCSVRRQDNKVCSSISCV
jgi:hypothetical protein